MKYAAFSLVLAKLALASYGPCPSTTVWETATVVETETQPAVAESTSAPSDCTVTVELHQEEPQTVWATDLYEEWNTVWETQTETITPTVYESTPQVTETTTTTRSITTCKTKLPKRTAGPEARHAQFTKRVINPEDCGGGGGGGGCADGGVMIGGECPCTSTETTQSTTTTTETVSYTPTVTETSWYCGATDVLIITDYYIVTEHTAVTTTYDVTQTTTVTDTVALPAETIFVPNPTPTVTSTNVVTSTKLLGYGACGPHATTL